MCIEGLTKKFLQNPTLAETLLNTGEKQLVECSYDKLWGTGVPLTDRACLNKEKWKAPGILGEMLMEIRLKLRNRCNTNTMTPMDTISSEASEVATAIM